MSKMRPRVSQSYFYGKIDKYVLDRMLDAFYHLTSFHTNPHYYTILRYKYYKIVYSELTKKFSNSKCMKSSISHHKSTHDQN